MSRKATILDQAGSHRKRLHDLLTLSDAEVLQLMRAATQGQTALDEADARTICHWAQAQKVGAVVLELVLGGHLRIAVAQGAVMFALLERVSTEDA